MGGWNHIFLLVHAVAAAVTAMCLGHSSLHSETERPQQLGTEASALEVTDNLKRFHKVISQHFVVWIAPLSTWITLDAWSCEHLHTRAALCEQVGSPDSAGMLPRVFRPAGHCSRAVLTPDLSCLVVLWGPSWLSNACGWGSWRPGHFLVTQIISMTQFPTQMERSDGAAKAGRKYPAVLFFFQGNLPCHHKLSLDLFHYGIFFLTLPSSPSCSSCLDADLWPGALWWLTLAFNSNDSQMWVKSWGWGKSTCSTNN